MAGASGDDSDDEFSKALECPIHLGVIQQPKALPCQHTFCRDCLEKLVSGSQIKCPICRRICRLSAKGVNDLPSNRTLQNILDSLCVSCQKTHLRTTCPCCQQQLCDKCKIKHASNWTRITHKNKDFPSNQTRITGKNKDPTETVTTLLSKIAVSPATVSCKQDEQLVQDVCMGSGQVEYKPLKPGAPTALLEYQPTTINYQEIGKPREVFGQSGSCPGQFDHPTHLAVSPVSGNLVVCDMENSRVQVFTADGNFIRMFGSKGKGEGQFGSFGHITSGGVTVTDGGEIVIADTGNDRLQVFDEAGGFVRVIGGKGSAPGKFNHPRGVTCDQSDHLYICDWFNHRIQVMTMDGSVVRVFMPASDSPGQWWRPVDIAVCPDGDLVLAGWRKGLQVFSATGQHKATIPCGKGQDLECRYLCGVAVDPQGNILVTDGGFGCTHRVYVLKKSSKMVCSFGGEGTSAGEFNRPAGVAVTQDGGIIVVDHGNHRVQIF